MAPVVEVENLKVHFPIKKGVFARTVGHVKAVDGVSFKLYQGETLGIVGSSGSGKSTLARALTNLVKPTSGSIKVEGRIALIFQDPLGSLNPRQSVGEIIGIQPGGAKVDVIGLLKDVGLPPEAVDKYPHEFSGGERQRVCIARALAVKPQILICDEAVSALDLSIRSQILELLSELRQKYNLSVIFITHDLGVVKHICERVLVMSMGRVVEEGLSQALFSSPKSQCTIKLVDSVLRIGTKIG